MLLDGLWFHANSGVVLHVHECESEFFYDEQAFRIVEMAMVRMAFRAEIRYPASAPGRLFQQAVFRNRKISHGNPATYRAL